MGQGGMGQGGGGSGQDGSVWDMKLREASLAALPPQVRVPAVLGRVRCGRAAPGGVQRAGAGRLRGGDRGLRGGGRPLRRHHAHQVAAVCRYCVDTV